MVILKSFMVGLFLAISSFISITFGFFFYVPTINNNPRPSPTEATMHTNSSTTSQARVTQSNPSSLDSIGTLHKASDVSYWAPYTNANTSCSFSIAYPPFISIIREDLRGSCRVNFEDANGSAYMTIYVRPSDDPADNDLGPVEQSALKNNEIFAASTTLDGTPAIELRPNCSNPIMQISPQNCYISAWKNSQLYSISVNDGCESSAPAILPQLAATFKFIVPATH